MKKNKSVFLLNNLTTSSSETQSRFPGIIDPPLQSSECTNHNDSCYQSSPKSDKSNILVYLLGVVPHGSRLLGSIELGDKSISWMRNDGTEDSGSITSREGDSKLLSLRIFSSRSGADVFVDHLNELFKCNKLHDGVWDLSYPEWGYTKIHTT